MTRNSEILEGKNALVTGACMGIGLEYAKLLASYNCNLFLVSNAEERLRDVADSLKSEYDVEIRTLCINLAQQNAAEEVFNSCKSLNFTIDILINNAGIFSFNDVLKTDMTKIESMILLHALTLTKMCRLFAVDMTEKKSGYILNMSSLSSWMSMPGIAIYNGTKSYIKNFSISLHEELKHSNVSVTALCPGGITTDLYDLSPKYQKLGKSLRVLMSPERLARKGINALVKNKRVVVPGFFNKIFIPITYLIPYYCVRFIKRQISKYEK